MVVYKKCNTILIFVIIVVMLGMFILYKNRIHQPRECSGNEGFIYNEDDLGAVLGLGGYRCGQCEPLGGSYISNNGYCKRCPKGQYFDGNSCVSCPLGQFLELRDYSCVCDESLGYHMTIDGCKKCAPGEEFREGECKYCTGGMVMGAHGQCHCPFGSTVGPNNTCTCVDYGKILVDGYCVCPVGSIFINGSCQCINPAQSLVNGVCS
jgi:hypothetical protein